jgi:hypothetical protein
MTFDITIHGVDGETWIQARRYNAKAVIDFLSAHDHEGSSIVLRIESDDDDVYETLTRLRTDL